VGILGGDKQLLFLYGLDNTLALAGSARRKKLLKVPLPIQAEAKVGMLCDHVHRFVDSTALDGGDLGLVIGIPDIDMDMGDDKDGPLLRGIDRLPVVLLSTANLDR